MGREHNASMEAIAAAIVAYLQAHPNAADSADGVARWWLGGRGAVKGASVDAVESALALLVERQLVRSVRLVDGTALFSKHP